MNLRKDNLRVERLFYDITCDQWVKYKSTLQVDPKWAKSWTSWRKLKWSVPIAAQPILQDSMQEFDAICLRAPETKKQHKLLATNAGVIKSQNKVIK